MKRRYCILEGVELTAANDSRAHILPMSLGWRYAPTGILCRDGNDKIRDRIEQTVIDAFTPVAAILGVDRQRGATPPVRVRDESGRELVFRIGEALGLARPEYTEEEIDGRWRFSISARTPAEARQFLGRVKRRVPELDIEHLLAQAEKARDWPEGRIGTSVQVGPASVFPFFFAAASVYAASFGLEPHPQFVNYVQGYQSGVSDLPPDTFYFEPGINWLAVHGELSHIAAIVPDASGTRCLTYFELFNTAGVAVLIPLNGRIIQARGHAVEVLSGNPIEPHIDTARVRKLAWASTHAIGSTEIMALQKERLDSLARLMARRSHEAALARAREEILGGITESALRPQDVPGMVERLAKHVEEHWRRPGTTPKEMKEDVEGFQRVCRDLEALLPAAVQSLFRRTIAEVVNVWQERIEQMS